MSHAEFKATPFFARENSSQKKKRERREVGDVLQLVADRTGELVEIQVCSAKLALLFSELLESKDKRFFDLIKYCFFIFFFVQRDVQCAAERPS